MRGDSLRENVRFGLVVAANAALAALGRCCWHKNPECIDRGARKATKTSSTVFEYRGFGLIFVANAALAALGSG